ncbi:MAG: H(+)/Cl(-) exchange transporter ClcA [bacterium ADurb.Bin429]|nr:MAG: H(+)/Cl(-) exchange transporter ClcA [bacterium ADurb.Bin429]
MHEHRQLQFARAALVGLGAGAVAVLFQYALAYTEAGRARMLEWLHVHAPLWGWLALPILGAIAAGFAGWMTGRFAPEAGGSGIPHIKGVLMHLRTLRWRALLPVKFIGGLLAIGAGLSLGREGPTVQMGAAVGKAIGGWLRLPRRSQPQLVAAGAGAGLAAAFNAPLAGFIFTIEELQRELSPLTYGTALIAAVVADIVTRSLTGQLPSFHIAGYPMPPMSVLPLFAVVGLVTGVMGVAFNRSLLWTLRWFHSLARVPRWARSAVVAALAGLLAWWLPQAVGGGHATAEALLRGDYAPLAFMGFLLLLFAAKFLLTIVSYGTGVPGGIFAPLLVLGATAGMLVGQLPDLAGASFVHTPAAFAVVGMAAAFSAIVRAPLTGIVLILEMTGNYQQLFPLLIACMIAFLVAERLQNKPIYEALLEYDLERGGVQAPGEGAEPVNMSVAIEPHSAMDGRRVRDLGLPEGCLLVTITRNGRQIIPGGNTRLRTSDHVTFLIAGNASESCALVQEQARTQG